MNLELIKKEAESFFDWPSDKRTDIVTLTSCLIFAQHCVDKATAWRPIAELTDENLPVWFCQGDQIWVGTKSFDDGWIYTHCHDTHYFDGESESWTCVDAEFDDDYKPTHFQHLPQPPEAA